MDQFITISRRVFGRASILVSLFLLVRSKDDENLAHRIPTISCHTCNPVMSGNLHLRNFGSPGWPTARGDPAGGSPNRNCLDTNARFRWEPGTGHRQLRVVQDPSARAVTAHPHSPVILALGVRRRRVNIGNPRSLPLTRKGSRNASDHPNRQTARQDYPVCQNTRHTPLREDAFDAMVGIREPLDQSLSGRRELGRRIV